MKNKEKAFSLIEVLVALAVLGIAILPILSMYPNALKMTVKATTNEEWSRVSMTIVDYVKSQGYHNLDTNVFGPSTTEQSLRYSEFSLTNGTYTNQSFENEFLGGARVFSVNSKGINLENYKFEINLTKVGGIYNNLDLTNGSIVNNSSNSAIIYGIVKIREKGQDFDATELQRDMKFIVTPIEEWRN